MLDIFDYTNLPYESWWEFQIRWFVLFVGEAEQDGFMNSWIV